MRNERRQRELIKVANWRMSPIILILIRLAIHREEFEKLRKLQTVSTVC